ncbi:Retrovirus-related Pol polyprotein from transposon RE1-like protein [Drosera capensis]
MSLLRPSPSSSSCAAYLPWPRPRGDLDEEVYMHLPPGYLHQGPNHGRPVCWLNKSFYSLIQASRNWYVKFSNALKSFRFCESASDHSVVRYYIGSHITLVIIYVDDMIIVGSDPAHIERVKAFIRYKFWIKDLGKYTLDILKEAGHLGAKPINFSMVQNLKFNATDDRPLKDPGIYRRLIYLTIIRPEITFAVNTLSQFIHSPHQPHMDAILQIPIYLKFAPGKCILLGADNAFQLSAFYDSDWASCPITDRSNPGYCTVLGDISIFWRTKKQDNVSRSSATYELLWLRVLLPIHTP